MLVALPQKNNMLWEEQHKKTGDKCVFTIFVILTRVAFLSISEQFSCPIEILLHSRMILVL